MWHPSTTLLAGVRLGRSPPLTRIPDSPVPETRQWWTRWLVPLTDAASVPEFRKTRPSSASCEPPLISINVERVASNTTSRHVTNDALLALTSGPPNVEITMSAEVRALGGHK